MSQLDDLHERMNKLHPCSHCETGHTVNEAHDVLLLSCRDNLKAEKEAAESKLAAAEARLRESEEALRVACEALTYVQRQLRRVEQTPTGHGLPAPGMAWVIANDTVGVVDRLMADIAKLRGDAKESK